jgi:hypothetical protein
MMPEKRGNRTGAGKSLKEWALANWKQKLERQISKNYLALEEWADLTPRS